MSETPNKKLDGYINVSVYSDGNEVKSVFRLVSFFIRKEINKIGKASLSFEAGDMSKGKNEESDLSTFSIGRDVYVEAGYGNEKELLFKGMITSHQFNIEENNETSIQIECRDYAFPMTLARHDNVFENQSDDQAIKEIAKKYKFNSSSIDIAAAKEIYSVLTQYQCSDWDFILARAEANGWVVVVEDEKLSAKEPTLDKAPALTINYGRDVIDFNGKLNSNDQKTIVKVVAWDSVKQKAITATCKIPKLNDQGNETPQDIAKSITGNEEVITTSAEISQNALQKMADARTLRSGLSRILGTCKFCGSAKAIPGELIELDGFGERFNGCAYIGYVEHEYNEYGWTTNIGMGLPDKKATEAEHVSPPSASGFLPGIQGLHIGKVTALKGDKDKIYKIKVELPVLDSNSRDIWVRLGNFWAGNSFGAFFIPDVDDEVIVGFINNDPCHPVILGSMYNAKYKPPYEFTENNNIRAIVSKSKMKIEMEEEKKVITIETPGKNKIVISDADKGIVLTDQHSNKIEMNGDGIRIESSKEIVLKAATNIKIEAGADLQTKAAANMNMKALKINAEADTELKMKGTAKAELSASGQTVVKGAMVLIN